MFRLLRLEDFSKIISILDVGAVARFRFDEDKILTGSLAGVQRDSKVYTTFFNLDAFVRNAGTSSMADGNVKWQVSVIR